MNGSLPQPTLNALPLGAHSLYALTDEALFAACGVRVAFTGREGGVSTGPYASLNIAAHVQDDLACVTRNREIVAKALGAVEALWVIPNQVHGTNVVQIDEIADVPAAKKEAREGADAVLVRASGVGALLNFADCLPFVIVAPDGSFVVGHAGWRGALAGIARKAADALAADGSDASGFNAYIGPHIHEECFETSEEIASQFSDEFGADVLADKRHVSLARVVTVDLMRAGMVENRIADAGICTVCHSDRYFSYRASGGICGRHAAAAIRT